MCIYATKDDKNQTRHKYCHLEIIYCFTMTQEEKHRVFITNPHNFIPQPHYSSDITGLLKWTIDYKCV